MKVCVYVREQIYSANVGKIVKLLELIMAQQSEIMPAMCVSSCLIKMDILILQKTCVRLETKQNILLCIYFILFYFSFNFILLF